MKPGSFRGSAFECRFSQPDLFQTSDRNATNLEPKAISPQGFQRDRESRYAYLWPMLRVRTLPKPATRRRLNLPHARPVSPRLKSPRNSTFPTNLDILGVVEYYGYRYPTTVWRDDSNKNVIPRGPTPFHDPFSLLERTGTSVTFEPTTSVTLGRLVGLLDLLRKVCSPNARRRP
jgi:hypothetical protein